MGFQLASLVLELISNVIFSRNGDEQLILDVIASLLSMVNECTMILLLMMIANGWMTKWIKYDVDDSIEIYLPLFLLIILFHVAFAALAFIDRNAWHKYHDYYGWAGFGLIMLKFCMVAGYFYFYTYCKPTVSKSASEFYDQIILIGLAYILSLIHI